MCHTSRINNNAKTNKPYICQKQQISYRISIRQCFPFPANKRRDIVSELRACTDQSFALKDFLLTVFNQISAHYVKLWKLA